MIFFDKYRYLFIAVLVFDLFRARGLLSQRFLQLNKKYQGMNLRF